MPELHPHTAVDRLVLGSQLQDLKTVWAWVDALAATHGIGPRTRFAIELCLEEVLSNVIRHGYRQESGHPITIDFSMAGSVEMTFTIEDKAPPFSPIDVVEPEKTPVSLEDVRPGSLGIPLMRKFAGSLKYERLADGNRLTIGFPVEGSSE